MIKLVFYPEFNTIEEFNDIYYRSVWHFSHVEDFDIRFLIDEEMDLNERKLPRTFDPKISRLEGGFFTKTSYVASKKMYYETLQDSDVIMKWKESEEVNTFISKFKNKMIYRVDPSKVRQEGSFYIQCVFDNSSTLKQQSLESCEKFKKLSKSVGSVTSTWILATGPSVDRYREFDFKDTLVIACNSTILDESLFQKTKPRILVFADPIFHFGVSLYASHFREVVKQRLETSNIKIIIPLKYYSLVVNQFSEFKERIIGVEFDNKIDFNLDLTRLFKVKTTSNILSLLLIPVATTFSKNINMLGCDGRPFEDDEYFWKHGKTVQLFDDMKNIQEVHPGFFKIDYNEYYFEHCHILDILLTKAFRQGISIKHRAPSHIPALRDSSFQSNPLMKFDSAILIEPDGIGIQGHYVRWHNQLIKALESYCDDITLLCNRKQETGFYNCNAEGVFTAHSWAISRSDWSKDSNFAEHGCYTNFRNELLGYLERNIEKYKGKVVVIYCYYGSVQLLNMLNELKRQTKKWNVRIKISICLFHESVILQEGQNEPKLPSHAAKIILESVSQPEDYIVRSVTSALSDWLYVNLEVMLEFMPNPLPAETIQVEIAESNRYDVAFPCALRPEKGQQITLSFLKNAKETNSNLYIASRSNDKTFRKKIFLIENHIEEGAYRSLLLSSSIIVIPYLSPNFKYRTSGIIVDAMLAKKPVIVLKNTWLSEIVDKYMFGLSIHYRSNHTLASAIKVILENYEFFSTKAEIAYAQYEKDHNWENLVKLMFSFRVNCMDNRLCI